MNFVVTADDGRKISGLMILECSIYSLEIKNQGTWALTK